jgi:hypothetical protein
MATRSKETLFEKLSKKCAQSTTPVQILPLISLANQN